MRISVRRHAWGGRHAVLLSTAAPLAVAIAIGAGAAHSAGLPIPSVPPPSPLTNWRNVTLDPGYNPAATTGSVTVSASRAYAEWAEFNTGAGNIFTVNGQKPDWILVNRAVSPEGGGPPIPSTLSGTIASVGQVWLINASGIAVTNTGVFNVGGLLLSTATGFDEKSFLGGSLNFAFTGASQAIQMDGTVNASSGMVALLAPLIGLGGKVLQTPAGAVQVATVAAQDVSLVFTDTGTVLALDGVTINIGANFSGGPGCGKVCPPIPGGITLAPGSQIRASRIVVAAAGDNLASSIVAGGALTATQARGDGQDIVLMVADQTGTGGVLTPELSGGLVQSAAVTTITGGDTTIDTTLVNTTAANVKDPAAADGASLMIRDAGSVHIGAITNAVGDVDIGALANVDEKSAGGGVISGRDIGLHGGIIMVSALSARDDVAARAGGAFTATSIAAGQTVAGQPPVDVFGAADRLIASAGAFKLAAVAFDLTGHDVDVIAGAGLKVSGLITAAPTFGAKAFQSDVRLGTADGISVDAVTTGGDILIDNGARAGGVTGGALLAGRDVAVVTGIGSVTLASADAGDDIVLRSPTSIDVAGALTTHGNDSVAPGQAGDLLAALDPITAFGATFALTGSSVDVKAGTTVTVGGQTTAAGPMSDARFQAPLALTVMGVTAGQDLLIDGAVASGNVSAGALVAGRDIGVRSQTGSLTLASADAGDDIVLRSPGA
ncbi:MAG TPA: filamentous hemagglutinin N-terminal domain-containing protein, partial [Caulobacteraceae bacterium]